MKYELLTRTGEFKAHIRLIPRTLPLCEGYLSRRLGTWETQPFDGVKPANVCVKCWRRYQQQQEPLLAGAHLNAPRGD